MISCFPFEGFFKICHGLFNGSRAIAEQITRNLAITEQLSFIKHFSNFKLSNVPGLEKLANLLNKKSQLTNSEETALVNAKVVKIDELCEREKNLLCENLNISDLILESEKINMKINIET